MPSNTTSSEFRAWSEMTTRSEPEVGGSPRCAFVRAFLPSWRSHSTRGGGHGNGSSGNRGSARAQQPTVRDDRHRRRTGGPCGRLLPEEAGPLVRDPRRERTGRRLVANEDVGLAAAVHPDRKSTRLNSSHIPLSG